MRILIADDDLASCTLLKGLLEKDGYEVQVAANGAEAWRALQRRDAPELVILDWIMPEMDGPEVVRRVRARETAKPHYILMLTSRSEKGDIIAGLEAGANGYLAKPFDAGELRARVLVGRRMIELQTALLESREALLHQATYDPLTGLFNRRSILDKLQQELSRASRGDDTLAVAICDIDHFKQVNDTYGHQTGDDVLQGFAAILRDSLRSYDSAGRIGGEEFLLIAPLKAGTDSLSQFDRLRAEIASSGISTRSGVLSVTVSIGVACATACSTLDKMMERADAALYRAKRDGRNRVACDNALQGEHLCAP